MPLIRPVILWALASVIVGATLLGAGPEQRPVTELSSARSTFENAGFTGTTLVYLLGQGSYQAAHSERANRRLTPASTFKILSSLIALEIGIVDDENTIIRWDGVVRKRRELNRDLG